jgi:hypothetical protein
VAPFFPVAGVELYAPAAELALAQVSPQASLQALALASERASPPVVESAAAEVSLRARVVVSVGARALERVLVLAPVRVLVQVRASPPALASEWAAPEPAERQGVQRARVAPPALERA